MFIFDLIACIIVAIAVLAIWAALANWFFDVIDKRPELLILVFAVMTILSIIWLIYRH